MTMGFSSPIRLVDILVHEIIPVCGVPESLLSDRGTNLLSYLMTDVCSLLGISCGIEYYSIRGVDNLDGVRGLRVIECMPI